MTHKARTGPLCAILIATALTLSHIPPAMAEDLLIIDDRQSGDSRSNLGSPWRLVTDGVMGGVSSGQLLPDTQAGRACLRITGEVRLENNGGFLQAALDLPGDPAFDASAFAGLELDVYGNDEPYNLHLRTDDVWLPWQSYRATFTAGAGWHTVRLPFADFSPYRIGSPLDLARLKRIGIVAIGRAFRADLCVARLALYRVQAPGSE